MSAVKLCQFCYNNGEAIEKCQSHQLRTEAGLISCPVLRAFVCPRCKATGDQAHTLSHCPFVAPDNSGLAVASLKRRKNSAGEFNMQRPPIKQERMPALPPASPSLSLQEFNRSRMALLMKHQECLEFYRKKWMHHQAEINRLQALRKYRERLETSEVGAEAQQEQHFNTM